MECNNNQSFCLIDQTVKGNLKNIINNDAILNAQIGNKIDPLDFLNEKELITVNIWELLEQLFKAINNYGEYGNRDFPQVENNEVVGWPTVEQFNFITPESYNDLINLIKQSNQLIDFNSTNKNNIILGTYFQDLKTYIENYKIDENRCDSCNISCYSSYTCSQGCGEACDYGNMCSGNYSCYQGCGTCQNCQSGYCTSCNVGCYNDYHCDINKE